MLSEKFSGSTTDCENYFSQPVRLNYLVFYWLDLVWHWSVKVRCVLKRFIMRADNQAQLRKIYVCTDIFGENDEFRVLPCCFRSAKVSISNAFACFSICTKVSIYAMLKLVLPK